MKNVLIIFLGLVIIGSASISRADTITVSDQVALQSTDFNKTMNISQFNPSLGTLTQVTLTFSGELVGDYGYENYFGSSAYPGGTWKFKLDNQLDVKQGSTSVISLVRGIDATGSPVTIPSIPVPDGLLDFAGTSGATVSLWDDTQNQTFVYTNVADLAQFIGTGTLAFAANASGASTQYSSNPQGLVMMTASKAGATVSATYEYIVPEPSAFVLTVLGMIGMTIFGLRRKF
jgi:hypothetical protein